MPTVRMDDGTAIAYRSVGEGPIGVLLLHAWGTSGESFTQTMSRLDPTALRAVAVDLRGHGSSDAPDGELSIERITADVLGVADHLHMKRFVVVGESMGGMLAQHVAVTAPTRVLGLVLVASAPASGLPAPASVRAWLELAGDGEAFLEHVVIPYLHRSVPEQAQSRLAASWEQISPAYLERTLELGADASFADDVRRADPRSVVVSGAHDSLHSSDADEVLDALPSARQAVLDAGGSIPREVPTELAAVIQEAAIEWAAQP